MNILINAPPAPYTHGYTMYADGKKVKNKNDTTNEFTDGEIQFILGDKNFKKFESGKYTFNIAKWKVEAIEGIYAGSDDKKIEFSLHYKMIGTDER